jgi:hypothetical protein
MRNYRDKNFFKRLFYSGLKMLKITWHQACKTGGIHMIPRSRSLEFRSTASR